MKEGRSLVNLAVELERQSGAKRDFIAPSEKIRLVIEETPEGPRPALQLTRPEAAEHFGIRRHAHVQLAERTKIPFPYYERMMEQAPALLAGNVNHWLAKEPDNRMVRTLDGDVRAYLSDRYRPLDNLDLANAVLPTLLADRQLSVISCEVTENRLYIKAVTARIQGEVKRGDPVQQGVVVSNSEVGDGSLRIESLLYRLVCLNGAIGTYAMRRAHVGKRNDLGEFDASDVSFTDRTKTLDDAAFWSKVNDSVRFVLSPEHFHANLRAITDATERKVERPAEVVQVLGKRFGLSETLRATITNAMIDGGDRSVWGIANAITRASQDVASYDAATDLERIGGQVIALAPTDWKRISAEAEALAV